MGFHGLLCAASGNKFAFYCPASETSQVQNRQTVLALLARLPQCFFSSIQTLCVIVCVMSGIRHDAAAH